MRIRYRNFYLYLLTLLTIGNFSIFSYAQCNFNKLPEGELCSSATYICGSELNGYSNSLPTKMSVDQTWTGLCNGNGSPQNIIWFSFTPCDSLVTLEITVNACYVFDTITQRSLGTHPNAGLQVGLYGGCEKGQWLDCSQSPSNPPGVTGTFRVSSNKFTPGKLGYLYLDGYNVSLTTITICNFSIRVINGISTTPVTPPDASLLDEGNITGNNSISCEDMNKPITYTLIQPEREVAFNQTCLPPSDFNPADSICYVWNVVPSNGRQFVNGDSTGTTVDLSFSTPGTYTISAETHFNPFYVGSCANVAAGKINTWTVTVLPPVQVTEPTEFLCPGDNRVYCGQPITKDTTIICNQDPCRIVTKEFKVGTSKLNLMGTQYICEGSSFSFQGVNYTQSGSYDVIDNVDCALLHRFTVENVAVTASVSMPVLVLDCNNPELTLVGSGNTNGTNALGFEWKDINNNILASGTDLKVQKPGEYIFTATYKTSTATCSDWERVRIDADFRKPSITANLPTVRCTGPKDPKQIITITSSEILNGAKWTTPLGAVVNTQNLVVDSLNAATGKPYAFTATGNNGCRLDTSFVLKTNFDKAVIYMHGNDLSCYFPKQTLSVSTSIPIDSIRWSKSAPNPQFFGSHLSKLSHDVIESGTYRVEVLASSSKCWNDETLYIGENKVIPDLTLNNEILWHCNTQSVDILPSTSTGSNITFGWKTTNGKILSDVTNKNLVAGSVGKYELVVFDVDNGCSRSGIIQVVEDTNIPVSIDFEAQDVRCFGENNGVLNIIGTNGGYEPYNYFLGGIELDQKALNNLKPGNYELQVRDKYDCITDVNFNVQEPDELVVTTEPEITIAFTDLTLLSFICNYPNSEISSVVWTDSKGEILGDGLTLDYSNSELDIVTVEVTNTNGCISRSQIKINVDNELKLYFPNIFSPNGDGVNDKLIIGKNKIPADINRISIFDRYGNMVYNQKNVLFNDDSDGWDGTFNNDYVVPGVYVMIIELTDYFGKKQVLKKDITIIP